MTSGSPKVSVVIPTLNAGPGFEELLEKICTQEGEFDPELLVVDSGSTDGTDERARRYGATVHRISREEFNHGTTRNLGISLSRGEYVVLTVQDAVPLDEQWISTMVENLVNDERVAGVYGRQVPYPDASALTRVLVNSLATASPERREQFAGGPEQYRALPPKKRRRLAAFDNVSSCLRRSVWEELPFEETNFGEDTRWGKKVVEAGYKTVYEPRSAVYHSHERGVLYDLRRYYVDQRLLLELFGLKLVPNLAALFLTTLRSSLHLYRLLRRDEAGAGVLPLLFLAINYSVPAQLGNYLGARIPKLARSNPHVFKKMHRFLSEGV